MSDEQTIVLPVSNAPALVEAEAVQTAASAEIAAEAAQAAIAASNAASAMAEIAASEQIREVIDDVTELQVIVESEKENFKWLVQQVEVCLSQCVALTAENAELRELVLSQQEIIGQILQPTPSEESPLANSQTGAPEIPIAAAIPEHKPTPESEEVVSPVPQASQKRKHRPL